MLEILLLIHLGKKIAAKAREKGRSGGAFVALLLFLWFGGEIAAMIAAMVVLGDGEENFFMCYLAALVGAAVGGCLAFVAVNAIQPAYKPDDYEDYDRNDRERY